MIIGNRVAAPAKKESLQEQLQSLLLDLEAAEVELAAAPRSVSLKTKIKEKIEGVKKQIKTKQQEIDQLPPTQLGASGRRV